MCKVKIVNGYPFLVNDINVTSNAMKYASEFLGAENIEELDLRMTGEDFAYYSQVFPTTFYRLGITDKARKIKSPLHSPAFNIDEKALKTGMATMAWVALSLLLET
jgi:metal-dependent amidase/aminoacylase/carboxypeptidase family protein